MDEKREFAMVVVIYSVMAVFVIISSILIHEAVHIAYYTIDHRVSVESVGSYIDCREAIGVNCLAYVKPKWNEGYSEESFGKGELEEWEYWLEFDAYFVQISYIMFMQFILLYKLGKRIEDIGEERENG